MRPALRPAENVSDASKVGSKVATKALPGRDLKSRHLEHFEDDFAPPSGQIPRGDSPSDPSWIPSSAQVPQNDVTNVSNAASRKRNATPDKPEQSPRSRKKSKRSDNSVNHTPPKDEGKGRKKTYHGYNIISAFSPPQTRERRHAPARPLKIRPLRSNDQPMQYLPGNEPKLNSEIKADGRPPITVQRNGAALPQKTIFDPWNLNSAGHQTGDGGSIQHTTAWKETRELKLGEQYGGGRGGGAMFLKRRGRELRGQQSIVDCFGSGKATHIDLTLDGGVASKEFDQPPKNSSISSGRAGSTGKLPGSPQNTDNPLTCTSTIFKDLVIYIDGSTLPIIGDHHLRNLISLNGGSTTMGLARKRVTHVILTPKIENHSLSTVMNSNGTMTAASRRPVRETQSHVHSAGAGLAAGKIQKEIATMRGPSRSIKFVSPAWVTESIKAGKRLPEARFVDWKMANEMQPSVMEKFMQKKDEI